MNVGNKNLRNKLSKINNNGKLTVKDTTLNRHDIQQTVINASNVSFIKNHLKIQ